MNRWVYLCLCAGIGSAFGLISARVIVTKMGLASSPTVAGPVK